MNPEVSYRNRKSDCIWLVVLFLVLAGNGKSWAQRNGATGTGQTGTAAAPTAKDNPAEPAKPKTDSDTKTEVSIQDTGTTFKLRVNLVQVRVVVRDSKGNLVPGLAREDFQLYDQGKLQMISTFGVETPKTRLQRAEAEAKTQQREEAAGPGEKVTLPQRFIALVFDDINLNMQDAMVLRSSAKSLIETLEPTDRLAIYGTSGQIGQDFTSDKEALENALLPIVPRPKVGQATLAGASTGVNHYMADQAINNGDTQALAIVTQQILRSMYGGDARMLGTAQIMAQSVLEQELMARETENEFTFRALEDVVRRMLGLPGERVLLLASPGFPLTLPDYLYESELTERALRAGVVINTLDARGLYTPDLLGDISQDSSGQSATTAGPLAQYRLQQQLENEYVLGDFASGTGGVFFHNSNDLAGGLKRLVEAPETSYVLGFSPQNQKMDGKYHNLKVTLANKQKYNIQARRGYYAPKKANDPEQQAKQEIAEAVFSQEEIRELPLELQTQYFKTGDGAHLSVVSHIDIEGLHFRRADGRNWDNLTIATVVFDENGNFLTGGEKLYKMRLLDPTLVRFRQTGVTMKSSFDVKPGKYLIRQVVRDSEGAQMAARNGAVVIPQ